MDLFYIIIYIIVFVTFLIFLIDTFVPKVFKGKLILKINKVQKGRRIWYSILWGGFLLLWSIRFILDITEYAINLPWILLCTLQIVRISRPVEIREKGMNFDLDFHKFSKIISYTWKSDNILRIHYNKILKQDDYFNLEINDKDTALKVDEVLQKYVKKDSASTRT